MPSSAGAVVAALCVIGAVAAIDAGGETFAGPSSPAEFDSWIADLRAWRNDTRASIAYHGGKYNIADLKWTQTSFISPLMHPYDRFFFDDKTKQYTVDRFLKDLEDRYGGIDSMLLWPTYPTCLGVDDRNQYDCFRAMPGGLDGLRKVIGELHARGVKVLLPYNPWDQGTRPEAAPDAEALAGLLKKVNGDGLMGDTMQYIPQEFWDAAVKVNHPYALAPETQFGPPHTINTSFSNWGTMSWGYWWPYSKVPSVSAYKMLDSRFMVNVCQRWMQSRVDDLQHAFFNGVGYIPWENIWGIWNGIVPADAEALRRISTILRYFGNEHALTASQLWTPHVPVIESSSVFASRFDSEISEESVWLFVNRGTTDISGDQLQITEETAGARWFDCYHGVELKVSSARRVSFAIEAQGYGCVFMTTNATLADEDGDLQMFLAKMHAMTARPLSSFDSTWHFLPQTMVDIAATKAYSTAPAGMVRIPGGSFDFVVSGVELEGTSENGGDVQYPWEDHPQIEHSHVMQLNDFYIDKFPVTCSEFAKYIAATGFKPTDPFNWLKGWVDGKFPEGHEKKPVTYVSLDEARGYCAWAGKRLPHSYEWQRAAQGNDSRMYPWGNTLDQSRFPVQQHDRIMPSPADVDAHSPAGDSPYGVGDLVGNVWQYTDEFQDEHTRAVIVRGSALYRPEGSDWYFPNALELNKHNKYLLFSDSYERAGTIGFRCAADAA